MRPTSPARPPEDEEPLFIFVGSGKIYACELRIVDATLPEPLDIRDFASEIECCGTVYKSPSIVSRRPARLVAGGCMPEAFVHIRVSFCKQGLLPDAFNVPAFGFETAISLACDIFGRYKPGETREHELGLIPIGAQMEVPTLWRRSVEMVGTASSTGSTVARIRFQCRVLGQRPSTPKWTRPHFDGSSPPESGFGSGAGAETSASSHAGPQSDAASPACAEHAGTDESGSHRGERAAKAAPADWAEGLRAAEAWSPEEAQRQKQTTTAVEDFNKRQSRDYGACVGSDYGAGEANGARCEPLPGGGGSCGSRAAADEERGSGGRASALGGAASGGSAGSLVGCTAAYQQAQFERISELEDALRYAYQARLRQAAAISSSPATAPPAAALGAAAAPPRPPPTAAIAPAPSLDGSSATLRGTVAPSILLGGRRAPELGSVSLQPLLQAGVEPDGGPVLGALAAAALTATATSDAVQSAQLPWGEH